VVELGCGGVKILAHLKVLWEIIKMKYIFVLFFSIVSVHAIEQPITFDCENRNVECAKKHLDAVIEKSRLESLDKVIELIKSVEGESALKENLLGVAHLYKKDETSLEKAKQYLESALAKGVKEAAQNLAELYFYKDDIDKARHYLSVVARYGYTLPDYKYVNWARLDAQIAYLSAGEDIAMKGKAIEIFREISCYDESGVAHYFLGHFSLFNDEPYNANEFLKASIKKGNLKSMLLYADIHYLGEKVNKDINIAKHYYHLAGEKGSGKAFYNLAMIARNEENFTEMKKYLTQSANLGYKKAVELFNKLASK
jgi:TPR repeat protein